MDAVQIGLLGLGNVGCGVVQALRSQAEALQTRLGASLLVKAALVRDPQKVRKADLSGVRVTRDPGVVLDDPETAIVVEVMGGEEPARTHVLRALRNRKAVVTANKALLAAHGNEVFRAAQEAGVDVAFEASVGGGMPIIRVLREGFAANRISSIRGILNGTTNYILRRMTDEEADFEEVLRDAQEAGYAEPDPTFDISGVDSAQKLMILASLAFGVSLKPGQVYCEGIEKVTAQDIRFAREFGYTIKLLAIGRRLDNEVEVRVHPVMIPAGHLLAGVPGVYNAVALHGNLAGENTLIGRGAGAWPTASAVVSDLLDVARGLRDGGTRVPFWPPLLPGSEALRVKDMLELVTQYYFRFSVPDRPGVLSKISGVLGNRGISIEAVIQHGRHKAEAVQLVMLTHEARERDVRQALAEIARLEVITADVVRIRVEDPESREGRRGAP